VWYFLFLHFITDIEKQYLYKIQDIYIYSCSTIGTGRSIHVKNSMINQERTKKGGIDLFENLEPSIYDSPEM
jgi:hypothetical protein